MTNNDQKMVEHKVINLKLGPPIWRMRCELSASWSLDWVNKPEHVLFLLHPHFLFLANFL